MKLLTKSNVFALMCCALMFAQCMTKNLYDNNLSYVINLNNKNFVSQITANRSKGVVSIVHYYSYDEEKSTAVKEEYEKLASEYSGLFKVAAVNCKEFKDLCEKQDVRSYPTFKVYPPLPTPVMDYEGKVLVQSFVSYLGKFIGNKSEELNNNNIDSFLTENANLPKCILFTDKKGTPLIFRSLSFYFEVNFDFMLEKN